MFQETRIWLIGGTSESATIAPHLLQHQLPTIVTVTTPAARQLYPVHELLTVQVGAMNPLEMSKFTQTARISAIVDASHPHAAEVSANAIRVAQQHQIPYLRYERPTVTEPGVTLLPDWETLLTGAYLRDQRVLLIVGYRHLPPFQSWHDRATLFARILPSPKALEVAIASGFPPSRLIALRPPVAPELERALWQQWQISLVVAKTSGTAGGQDVKQTVARSLGIPLILIDRPQVNYPQITQDWGAIVEFCCRHLSEF